MTKPYNSTGFVWKCMIAIISVSKIQLSNKYKKNFFLLFDHQLRTLPVASSE